MTNNISKKTYKLFNIIPILKTKTKNNITRILLFGFIPLFKIKTKNDESKIDLLSANVEKIIKNTGYEYKYDKLHNHNVFNNYDKKNIPTNSKKVPIFSNIDVTKINPFEFKKDVEVLKANLSEKEKEKVDILMERLKKIMKYQILNVFYQPEDIYTEKELEEKLDVMMCFNTVEKIDDYYQYQNYKFSSMPCYDFSALYYKYNIDNLKQKVDGAILDVGAYNGDSSLVFADKFKDNKVYSFEVVEHFYDLLKKTIELNDFKNIIPLNIGISDNEGEQEFSYEGHKNICKITTIDNFAKQNNIKIGLIKTDIEGGEWALLQGAIETIKRDKPVLKISIYHNYRDFFKIKPFIESLNCGYKFSFEDGSGYHIYGGRGNVSFCWPINEIILSCEVY
ncbi:MAG: hypothetical protein Ta2D_03230 [Rickettsiales bacterium]|nr:MAG: hypothetical protein Ta2D_03230 [Rickettsiales bacterium]